MLRVKILYAGFWIRFLAKFIDNVILGVVSMIFSFIGDLSFSSGLVAKSAQGVFTPIHLTVFCIIFFLQIVVSITYSTFFVGKFAATPGKMVCGLKIVTSEGGAVNYLTAFSRYFAEIISALILMAGYIMAAFDSRKRALHDHVCNTLVIRR